MLFERMMRAARLDVNLYEEVEADQNATSQAATVVGIVAVCTGIASAVRVATAADGGGTGAAVLALVWGLVSAFLGWVIWSYVTYWIGTSIFKGTATPGELLRTIGFANSPGVLSILGFVPLLGGIIGLVVLVWTLITGVVAIRQALDISTGQAVITAVIGMVIYCALGSVLALFGLGGAALTGAL